MTQLTEYEIRLAEMDFFGTCDPEDNAIDAEYEDGEYGTCGCVCPAGCTECEDTEKYD